MDTEQKLYADRATLRSLRQAHPDYTYPQLAIATHRSVSWVKKWLKRFKQADPTDDLVLWSQSRARKNPNFRISRETEELILEIRDNPPDNLKRVPGPVTILYYLEKHEQVKSQQLRIPRSSRTIWQILTRNQRILHPKPRKHQPLIRPNPMVEFQIDFKDNSFVKPTPDGEGKRQHLVEPLNIIDVGSDILVAAEVSSEYNAETALDTLAQVLLRCGLPKKITLDRDPRWVGSASGRDFPSALLRFLACIGIEVNLCPPHRPDMNGIVERLNKSYGQECLQVFRPGDYDQSKEYTAKWLDHYNHERPQQSPGRRACPQAAAL